MLRKERVEHSRARALAQAVVNREKGKEAFDDYMKVAYPWLEQQKSREKTDHIRILTEEVKKGGLSIRPLWQETHMRSRLRTRVVEHAPDAKHKSREELNALYAKLGKSIPI